LRRRLLSPKFIVFNSLHTAPKAFLSMLIIVSTISVIMSLKGFQVLVAVLRVFKVSMVEAVMYA